MTIDGRHGIIIERIHGPSLTGLLTGGGDADGLAQQFVALHQWLQARALPGLPELSVASTTT